MVVGRQSTRPKIRHEERRALGLVFQVACQMSLTRHSPSEDGPFQIELDIWKRVETVCNENLGRGEFLRIF